MNCAAEVLAVLEKSGIDTNEQWIMEVITFGCEHGVSIDKIIEYIKRRHFELNPKAVADIQHSSVSSADKKKPV